MEKSLGDWQKLTNEVIASQMTEQNVIGNLAARIKALEKKLAS